MSTEQITIRLPAERVALLKAAAKADHRSLAQQVEHMLSKFDVQSPPARPRDLDEALAEIERETPLTDIPRRPPGTLLKTLKGATKS